MHQDVVAGVPHAVDFMGELLGDGVENRIAETATVFIG
jgi:hypothetical protein